ncbi:MAG: hypothetical protein PHO41_04800, partial [Eubacteriales bacterium]|nr:hypothetical protein [Eubacteriales bacterium]
MRKHLVMITAVVSLALILLGFTGCSVLMPTSHTTNVADQDAGLAVAENFYLFSGSEIGYSFLYPKTREVGFSKEDGAYIYCGEDTAQPYVLVCRIDKRGMSPEKYFKACDKLMLDTFQNVQSTPINEVELGDKTLYLTRYACDGLVIDRYVELYDGFYIQYTAISNEAGALNTELYYAISTLRVNEGAYKGAYSETVSVRRHPDLAMQIDIPDMLEVKELTLGYFSTNENAVMLT